jgi:hypothetical protein
MPELGNILQQYPNITALRFFGENINGADIINILKRNAITNLSFEGSKFDTSDEIFFSEALMNSKTLTHLTVSNATFMSPTLIINIINRMRGNKSITYLNISNNNISLTRPWKLIRCIIEENSTLTDLDISGNKLNLYERENFPNALKKNKTLLSLKLKNCSIDVPTFSNFAEGVKVNNTLKYIDFSDNNLGDAGKEIAQEIQRVRAEKGYPHLEIVL